jgi:hypothetical protein
MISQKITLFLILSLLSSILSIALTHELKQLSFGQETQTDDMSKPMICQNR